MYGLVDNEGNIILNKDSTYSMVHIPVHESEEMMRLILEFAEMNHKNGQNFEKFYKKVEERFMGPRYKLSYDGEKKKEKQRPKRT